MLICNFCQKECPSKSGLGNHKRFCPHNPNRVAYVSQTTKEKGHIAWNKGLDKTDERVARLSAKAAAAPRRPMSEQSRQNISRGTKGKTGGYRENAGISKKFRVEDSFGKITCLQSSYELEVSKILNELEIKWLRPKALKYDGRNYFADFYLPDFDVWLDPKNDYKAKLDEEKIRKVIEQNNVKLFVLLKEQINAKYICSIAQR